MVATTVPCKGYEVGTWGLDREQDCGTGLCDNGGDFSSPSKDFLMVLQKAMPSFPQAPASLIRLLEDCRSPQGVPTVPQSISSSCPPI